MSTTLYLELFGAMNRNLNASSAAEAFPSMDPSMAQLFLLHLMNYNPYYLLGLSSMTQTGANVPSFSVGFPKIYFIILRFQDAVNDPSLHPGTSGFKSLKLNCLITINIVSFLRVNMNYRFDGRLMWLWQKWS